MTLVSQTGWDAKADMKKAQMRIFGALAVLAWAALSGASPAAAQSPPPGTILARATEATPEQIKFARNIGVNLRITRDGRLFAATWSPNPNPRGWVVVLPDAKGWAQEEIALWHPTLVRKSIGIVAMQWWYGTGDGPVHYANADVVYRELEQALRQMGMKPGTAMLYGIGRGAEIAYAIQAYDRHAGGKFFGATLANSGAMAEDVAANRRVAEGQFGLGPFDDTRWIFYCGGRDADANRAGCPAMRGAANAVRKFGGKNELFLEEARGSRTTLLQEQRLIDSAIDKYLSLPR
jgi:hypothetical protein